MASTAPQLPQAGPSLNPETFQSLLPKLNELLELVKASASPASTNANAEGNAPPAESAITKTAIEIRTQLAKMRDEIEKLPGGHMSIEEIREVSARLEVEAAKRRKLLETVTKLNMPILDECVKEVEAGDAAAATADHDADEGIATHDGDTIMT